MDGRPIAPGRPGVDLMEVSSPAVPAARCLDCESTWNSAVLVDGLRLIGSCPRCGVGRLEFRDATPDAAHDPAPAAPSATEGDASRPHLVMGVPRR